MHLAIIQTANVSLGRVLVGTDRRKPSGGCAERLAELPRRLFSPLGADPPRRQPPGLLALGGRTRDASTPTVVKGIGPASCKHRQSRSHWTPSGTSDCRKTMESSSDVRVIEKNSPLVAQAGTAAPASSQQTAKVSGRMVSVRRRVAISRNLVMPQGHLNKGLLPYRRPFRHERRRKFWIYEFLAWIRVE